MNPAKRIRVVGAMNGFFDVSFVASKSPSLRRGVVSSLEAIRSQSNYYDVSFGRRKRIG